MLSLMPEGLLDPLNPAEVRDLIAYLMHRSQVPLPRPEHELRRHPCGQASLK